MAAGALRKNLKNQERAVIDGHLKMALKVALLRWTKRLVEQDFSSARFEREHLDFISLSRANEQCRIRRPALASHSTNGLQACGLCQQTEFLQIGIKIGESQVNPYQKGECLCFHLTGYALS